MSLIFISSLKVILISLPLKSEVKLSGLLKIILGAIVSLAPPVMVPRLAQLESSKRLANIKAIFFNGFNLNNDVTK